MDLKAHLQSLAENLPGIHSMLVLSKYSGDVLQSWSQPSGPVISSGGSALARLYRAGMEVNDALQLKDGVQVVCLWNGDQHLLLFPLHQEALFACSFNDSVSPTAAMESAHEAYQTLIENQELAVAVGQDRLLAAADVSNEGRRLLEVFQRQAPDPHACLLRLALRTGLPVSTLEQPDDWTEPQLILVSESMQAILGQDLAVDSRE